MPVPPFQFSPTTCGYHVPWLPGRWIGGLTAWPSTHTRHQALRFAISSTATRCFVPGCTLAVELVVLAALWPGRVTS